MQSPPLSMPQGALHRTLDYMALSQCQLNASGVPDYAILHGPTNDPLSTATGGPSGGLPDSN